jgi:hypothetical protein
MIEEIFSRLQALENKRETPLISVKDHMEVCQCIQNEMKSSEVVQNLFNDASLVGKDMVGKEDLYQYDKFFLYQVAVGIYKGRVDALMWDVARERARVNELDQQLRGTSQLSVANRRLEEENERLQRDLRRAHERPSSEKKRGRNGTRNDVNDVRKRKMDDLTQLKKKYKIPNNAQLSYDLENFVRDTFRDVLEVVPD